MGRENPTLRDFGGGIPLSMMDSDDEREVRSREQFRKIKKGLGVPLERDLIERLDPQLLETGEDRHWLHLQPREADWVDAMYIRAEPTDEEWKFDHVVQNPDTDPLVEMPSALLRNEVVKGIDNPFHKADPDDYVVVRYLPEEAIEIYLEEVYKAHPHFVWIRAAAPFVVISSDDSEEILCYNLAASTLYGGQMFEIVPFDWEVFCEYFQDIIGRDLSEWEEAPPRLDEFKYVLRKGGVKPCSTLRIQIDCGTESTPIAITADLVLNNTGRFRVVLPPHRIIQVNTFLGDFREVTMIIHRSYEHRITDTAVEDKGLNFEDENGVTRINRKYIAPITEDQNWFSHFFEIQEHGPPIIYIPAKRDSAGFVFDPFD